MSRSVTGAELTRTNLPSPGEYTDPGRFRAQVDRLLARSWHVVAGAEEVAEPGAVLPRTLLPGALDEPLLLTRDTTGTLRALSNACTHRAALLVDRPCRADHLRCPYHGRRFRLDGRMVHAPEFDGAEGFPSAADDLPAAHAGTWGPLVFAALDPVMPLRDLLAAADARLGWVPWEELRRDPAGDAVYEVRAHWMSWCENYLEGFHVPWVHPGLAGELDWRSYRTELDVWGSTQVGVAPPGGDRFALPADHPDAAEPIAGIYVQVFPATMLNLYPWGLSLNSVEPVSPTLTRIRYRRWVWRPERLQVGAGGALDAVEREDDAIVESVARGLRARLYRPGRYAPRWEAAVWHFHQRVAELVDG